MQITSLQLDCSPEPRCDFCDELAGGSHNAFVMRYGPAIPNRCIVTHEGFCVLPSLGQIVEGHVLLIPQRHLTSMAELAVDGDDQLQMLMCQIRTALRSLYGKCLFFEHGIRRAGSGGCGIDHAHMHALPLSGGGMLNTLMQSFEGSRIHNLADIPRTIPPESSYLFFESSVGERYAFAAPNMPSQYMRKLACESIGKLDWDWRQSGREPDLFATIERLSPAFSAALAIPRE